MQQFASSLLELLLLLLLSDLVYNPYSSLSEPESWTSLNLCINFVLLRLNCDFLLSPIKHYRLPKRLNIDHNPAELKCPSFCQWQQRVESLALCNHCPPMTVDGIASAENAVSVPTNWGPADYLVNIFGAFWCILIGAKRRNLHCTQTCKNLHILAKNLTSTATCLTFSLYHLVLSM